MLSLKFLYNTPLGMLFKGRKKTNGDVVSLATDDPTLDDDPVRSSYIRAIPEAQFFRGVLLQGYLVPPAVLEGLEDMQIRDDDVFIITYPKSGTTWTEEIVSLIYNDGDLRRVEKELLIYRVEHLEVGRPLGHLRHLRGLKSPRLLATHLPLPLIPRQMREAKCKIIYVVRNPKDTAVSYYHHHKMSTFLGNYSGTWDQFLEYFMAGHVVYGSWFDHVLPYWKFCSEHPDKVFFLCYEELKMDLKGMVIRLCQFLDRNLSEASLDVIAEHCSFERMKTNNMVNREVLPITDLFDMSKSKFMRKGIIGDWINYFTPEQSAALNMQYQDRTAGSNLDLVFEPEEAFKRFQTYGRIIYNHPQCQKKTKTELQEEEDEPWIQSPIEKQRQVVQLPPKWKFKAQHHNLIPSIQIHLLPDPLTLDAF